MEIRVACVDVARDPRFDPVLMQIACLAQLYPKTKDPASFGNTRARTSRARGRESQDISVIENSRARECVMCTWQKLSLTGTEARRGEARRRDGARRDEVKNTLQ